MPPAATLAGAGMALWGRLSARRPIAAAAAAAQSRGKPGRFVGLLLLAALPCLGGGCEAFQSAATSPTGPYVAADRATHDAVAPEYHACVTADPALDDEQKARRRRTIESWRLRLEQAERRVADDQPAPAPSSTRDP